MRNKAIIFGVVLLIAAIGGIGAIKPSANYGLAMYDPDVQKERARNQVQARLARALYQSGDFKGALAAIEQANGQDASLYPLQLDALRHLERYQEGQQLALAAAARGKYPAFSYAQAAYFSYGIGDHHEAATLLKKSLQLGGGKAAWLLRARMAMDEHRPEVFQSALDRAHEAGTKADIIQALRIEALIRDGGFERARDMLAVRAEKFAKKQRKAMRKNMTLFDEPAAYLRGLLALAEGKMVQAVQEWQSIERWLVAMPGGRLRLAYAYANAGDLAQARQHLLTQLTHAPQDPVALDFACAFFLEQRDFDSAQFYASHLLAADRVQGTLRELEILSAKGQYSQAIQRLQDRHDIVQSSATQPYSQRLFGRAVVATPNWSLEELKRLSFSEENHIATLEASGPLSSDPVKLTVLGWHALHAGAFEQSQRLMDRALQLGGLFHEALYWRVGAALKEVGPRAGLEVVAGLRAASSSDQTDKDRALSPTPVTAEIVPAQAAGGVVALAVIEARLLAMQGEYETALNTLLPVQDSLYDDEERLFFLAALLSANQRGEALKTLTSRLHSYIDDPRVLGLIYEWAGLPARAAQLYRVSLRVKPEMTGLVAAFGRVSVQLDQRDEAISLLTTLAEKRPNLTDLRDVLAHLAKNETDQAFAPDLNQDAVIYETCWFLDLKRHCREQRWR